MGKELTPRKRQAMEMRSRIQQTAVDLFNREGFENVSVEEIAQAAGCSVGNIYHYFKSKDELAMQVTSQVDAQYLELQRGYRADTTHTAREKLLDFVSKALTISAQDEIVYKAFMLALRYPEQKALQRSDRRVYFNLLQELVELCLREGSIDPSHRADEVVEQMVVLHRGMLFEWRINERSFDIARAGREMAALLLKGMEPEK